VSQIRNHQEAGGKKDPENGGSTFFRKMVDFSWPSRRYNRTDWSRGNALDLHSEGTGLESSPGHLLILRFVVYLSPSKFWDSTYIRPLPFPSKSFLIHYSCHATNRRHFVSILKASLNNLRKNDVTSNTTGRFIVAVERTWNRIQALVLPGLGMLIDKGLEFWVPRLKYD
jgi:hypothetical protein